jgi:FAD/FMN-containing dehydrogenase
MGMRCLITGLWLGSAAFAAPTFNRDRFTKDAWVTAAEVRPSAPSVVHHVVAFVRPPGSQWMKEAKPFVPYIPPMSAAADDPQAKPGMSNEYLAGYSPGMQPERFDIEVRVAQTEEERAVVWKGRKAAFAAVGRISPNYIVQVGVIPRTALEKTLSEMDKLASEWGLRVANVFHAGDGNLHPLVLYDRRIEGQEQKAMR